MGQNAPPPPKTLLALESVGFNKLFNLEYTENNQRYLRSEIWAIGYNYRFSEQAKQILKEQVANKTTWRIRGLLEALKQI